MKPYVRCRPSKLLIYHCNDEKILSVMKSDICNYTPQKANYKKKWINLRFYPGDLVTCMQGDREISVISGRLPDNQGELAYMWLVTIIIHENDNNNNSNNNNWQSSCWKRSKYCCRNYSLTIFGTAWG